MGTNRRDALKRAFTFVGVAIGIGAANKDPAAQESYSPNDAQGKQLILHARRLRISSQDLRRGELPQPGVRMLAKADIISDTSTDRKVGDFFSTYYRVSAPGQMANNEPGSFEHHTFIFPEGSIFGSGVATSCTDSEGQFAITGGTGRYLGARGSYTARQSHTDFGGNGTATFTFTII